MSGLRRQFIFVDPAGRDRRFLLARDRGCAVARFTTPKRWRALAREGWTVQEVDVPEWDRRLAVAADVRVEQAQDVP